MINTFVCFVKITLTNWPKHFNRFIKLNTTCFILCFVGIDSECLLPSSLTAACWLEPQLQTWVLSWPLTSMCSCRFRFNPTYHWLLAMTQLSVKVNSKSFFFFFSMMHRRLGQVVWVQLFKSTFSLVLLLKSWPVCPEGRGGGGKGHVEGAYCCNVKTVPSAGWSVLSRKQVNGILPLVLSPAESPSYSSCLFHHRLLKQICVQCCSCFHCLTSPALVSRGLQGAAKQLITTLCSESFFMSFLCLQNCLCVLYVRSCLHCGNWTTCLTDVFFFFF